MNLESVLLNRDLKITQDGVRKLAAGCPIQFANLKGCSDVSGDVAAMFRPVRPFAKTCHFID